MFHGQGEYILPNQNEPRRDSLSTDEHMSRRHKCKQAIAQLAEAITLDAPPFKPGGSVGALVGRPGFRSGFARIRARGRGRGSVGAACSSRKKPLDLQPSYHLIYSLARPLPVRPPRVPLPTVSPANHAENGE